MRPLGAVRVGLVTAMVSFGASASAAALEVLPGTVRDPGPPIVFNPNAATEVRVIGDSISWFFQPPYYGYAFASAGWRTEIHALYGANMIEHWQNQRSWASFQGAAASARTRVVVIALGTNDLGGITKMMPTATRKNELQKVKDHATWSARYLSSAGKCVVFLNASTVTGNYDSGVAAEYNQHLSNLTAQMPSMFAVDYDLLVRTNANYRGGLFPIGEKIIEVDGSKQQKDGVHPKGGLARATLANWLRDQVRWYCRI